MSTLRFALLSTSSSQPEQAQSALESYGLSGERLQPFDIGQQWPGITATGLSSDYVGYILLDSHPREVSLDDLTSRLRYGLYEVAQYQPFQILQIFPADPDKPHSLIGAMALATKFYHRHICIARPERGDSHFRALACPLAYPRRIVILMSDGKAREAVEYLLHFWPDIEVVEIASIPLQSGHDWASYLQHDSITIIDDVVWQVERSAIVAHCSESPGRIICLADGPPDSALPPSIYLFGGRQYLPCSDLMKELFLAFVSACISA